MDKTTTCTLRIIGTIHLRHVETLCAAIEEAAPLRSEPFQSIDQTIRHFREPRPKCKTPAFFFHHRGDPQIDNRLASVLEDRKLSWSWFSVPDSDATATITYRNNERTDEEEFLAVNGRIVVPIDELYTLGNARSWDHWFRQADFTVAD